MIKKLFQAIKQRIARRVALRNQAAMYDSIARLSRYKFILAADLQRSDTLSPLIAEIKATQLAMGLAAFIVTRDFWKAKWETQFIQQELAKRLTDSFIYNGYDVLSGTIGYNFTLSKRDQYDGVIIISRRSELFNAGKSQSRAVLRAVRQKHFNRHWEMRHFKLSDPTTESQYLMTIYADGVN